MTALLLTLLSVVTPTQWSVDHDPWKVLFQVRLGEFGLFEALPEEPERAAIDERRGTITIGGRNGVLRCLDWTTGHERWRHESKGAIRVTPLVHKGRVYVGNMDGRFWALDAASGSVLWEAKVGDAVTGDAVVVGNRVLFTDARGALQAYDLEKGVRQWRQRREVAQRFTVLAKGTLVVQGNEVTAGFPDGHLLTFDATTGDVVRDVDLSGGARDLADIESAPLLLGDLLVAASYSGGLWGLDAASGTVRWHVEGAAFSFPTLHQGRLLVVKDGTKLLQVEPATGALTPVAELRKGSVRDLASVGGDLWLTDGQSLLRFDEKAPDGSLRVAFFFGVSAAPSGAGSRLYILSDSGYIYGIERP